MANKSSAIRLLFEKWLKYYYSMERRGKYSPLTTVERLTVEMFVEYIERQEKKKE